MFIVMNKLFPYWPYTANAKVYGYQFDDVGLDYNK